MLSSEFMLLAGAHLLALVSPGPDFLLLVRTALRQGRRAGVATAAGIALANGAYIVLALCGFSLLQQSPALLLAMKWLASAYLAWLGWMFIRSSGRPALLTAQAATSASGFAAGFLSGALNPKNGMFYFGLFTLMVGASTGLALKALYGLWMCAVVFVWDAALVGMVSQPRVMAWLSRALPVVEGGAGVLLMAAAVALALARG